jgi:hypothetical protein
LAGDSTMTKPFDNVSSISVVSVFEASTNGQKATSYRAKASSFQLLASSQNRSLQTLNERRQHSLNFQNLGLQGLERVKHR